MRSRYLKRRRYTAVQIRQMWADINAQTNDRALALVGGAFAEDALAELIFLNLTVIRGRKLAENEIAELFENYGPLHTFDLKIRMASALGIIDAEQRADLEIIKGIRNYFAHETQAVFFSDADVAQECASLNGWKDPAVADALQNKPLEQFRQSIFRTLALIALKDAFRRAKARHVARAHLPSQEKSASRPLSPYRRRDQT